MGFIYNYINKIEIDKKNFLEVCNINFNVYYPLNKFLDKKNFISVVNKMKLINGKFFPFPIFLNVRKKFDNYCIKGKKVELFFQKKKVCDFIIKKKLINLNKRFEKS